MAHRRPSDVPPPPMIVELRVPGGPVLASRPVAAAVLERRDRLAARGAPRGRPFWRGLSLRWARGVDGAPTPLPRGPLFAGGAAVLALFASAASGGRADAAIFAVGEAFAWTCYLAAVGVCGYAAWILVRGLRRR